MPKRKHHVRVVENKWNIPGTREDSYSSSFKSDVYIYTEVIIKLLYTCQSSTQTAGDSCDRGYSDYKVSVNKATIEVMQGSSSEGG
jgi:hypothetical protein